MKKTDFGFTCAESDEEKAKLILDRMKANGVKGVKFAVNFEPLNTWVHTSDRLHISVSDLSNLSVKESEDGIIYLEKSND